MENENLPDENLEDEEEEKENTTPSPTPSPAPAPAAPPESKGQALIEGSKASGEVKNRLT